MLQRRIIAQGQPVRKFPRGSNGGVAGSGWLLFCVLNSSLLLLLAWFGLNLPGWWIYVADPPAWIANTFGLTQWAGGFFPAMDAAWKSGAGMIGLPIVGSLILWTLYGLATARMGKILGWILPLAGCVALQFTVARGYLHLSENAREAGSTEAEAASLARVFYIVEKAGSVSMFRDGAALSGFLVRLGELQSDAKARSMFPPPGPIHIRLGQISITIESDLQPIPVPASLTRNSKNMAGYQAALKDRIHSLFPGIDIPVDVAGLGQVGFCDLRLFVGMQLPVDLLSSALLTKEYPQDAEQFLMSPADLVVHIHSSADELLSSFQGTVHTSSKLPNGTVLIAYYDRKTGILHLGVKDEDWRGLNLGMLRSAATLSYESQKNFLDFAFKSWGTPMAHEAWHFILQKMPRFSGLPPALEEGIASFAESIVEGVGAAAVANAKLFDQYPGAQNPDRDRLLRQSTSRCPPGFQDYLNVLQTAEQQHALIPVASLLELDWQGISEQPNVSLVYAEGWALTLRIWSSPRLMSELRRALARRSEAEGRVPPQDVPFWGYLDGQLVPVSREWCGRHE